jgi:hypothetical protein
MPRWANLESLVRVLVEKQRVGQSDADTTIVRIHTLWRTADGGILPEQTGESEFSPQPPQQEAIARWEHPRLGTVEFRDRQTAVEIFREVGGFGDQP